MSSYHVVIAGKKTNPRETQANYGPTSVLWNWPIGGPPPYILPCSNSGLACLSYNPCLYEYCNGNSCRAEHFLPNISTPKSCQLCQKSSCIPSFPTVSRPTSNFSCEWLIEGLKTLARTRPCQYIEALLNVSSVWVFLNMADSSLWMASSPSLVSSFAT